MARLSATKSAEAAAHIHSFQFMATAQKRVLFELLRGEEANYFYDTVLEIAKTFKEMPKTYDQDGEGDKAKAYIHLFNNSQDWYITEKDSEAEQIQAYGLKPSGNMGYINMVELAEHFNIEVDFHFSPTTLKEIKAGI